MCNMEVGQRPTNESDCLQSPSVASTAAMAGMAVMGVGIDLCEIARMQALLDEGRPLRRLFTKEEQAYIASKGVTAAQTMAGLYAAKEAVLKALGTGLAMALTDIVISHVGRGQPVVTLTGKAAEFGGQVKISITHEGGMAAAFAVWTE